MNFNVKNTDLIETSLAFNYVLKSAAVIEYSGDFICWVGGSRLTALVVLWTNVSLKSSRKNIVNVYVFHCYTMLLVIVFFTFPCA